MASEILNTLVKKMGWLSERNKVIATNLVNKGTPGFKAKDIEEEKFGKKLAETNKPHNVGLSRTNSKHLHPGPNSKATAQGNIIEVKSQESTLSGNTVDAEKEMVKATETSTRYLEMTAAYNKYFDILNTALGKSRR